jgi:hypothetical protein
MKKNFLGNLSSSGRRFDYIVKAEQPGRPRGRGVMRFFKADAPAADKT